jgi:ABC-type antimicrobial peptide transport system permease subunit
VALIDEKTAHVFWPNESAIGQRFRYSPYVPWITVVGVVGHVKTKEFTSTIGTAQAYMPISQESSTYRALLIRADSRLALTALGTIRSVIHGMDASVDLQQPQLVMDMYDDVFVAPRFNLLLMSLFAGLALLTAAFGLFGLLNYAVSQRTREIGVRLALGAGIGQIRALIVRDALVPVAGGIAAGLGGAFWLTRYLESLLYGVTPHDVRAYAGAVALLLAVAAMAAYLPARRATNVNPVTTLRVG